MMTPFGMTDPVEEARLQVLQEYDLLDTPPEVEFDGLTRLAARICETPIALVTLIDRHRQFLKARIGIDVCETKREHSFCTHAVASAAPLIVCDTHEDARFRDNPFVTGPPFIRFYAGFPLISEEGHVLGALCVIDEKARPDPDPEQLEHLSDIASLVLDRMNLRRAEVATAVTRSRLQAIAETSPDAILCVSAEGPLRFANTAAQDLFGTGIVTDSRIADILPEWNRLLASATSAGVRPTSAEAPRACVRLGIVETTARRADGTICPVEVSASAWWEGDQETIGLIVRDVTERRRSEEKLYRLAWRDHLTGLANRAALTDQLGQLLSQKRDAILWLFDLDGFKEVNDTLGHSAGDNVLVEVGRRITVAAPSEATVARLGGDEFAVVLANTSSRQLAEDTARTIGHAIGQPFEIEDTPRHVGVSIGIALARTHGTEPEELLAAADLALYQAKLKGRERFEFFVPSLKRSALQRQALQCELRTAFEADELQLFFQPQVSIGDGRVVGAEALLRWSHPRRGTIAPSEFLEVLGSMPLSCAVGDWAIERACAYAARWRAAGLKDIRIGVNVFETQFRCGRLAEVVEGALAANGLPADALELEITENTVICTDRGDLDCLFRLRRLGVGIALDDYGTGYASLSQLKSFPLSRLKIDRTFVSRIGVSQKDRALVRAILFLGRNFGLDVIAEGVETEEQAALLAASGCREVQGFLYGTPITATAFEQQFVRQSAAVPITATPVRPGEDLIRNPQRDGQAAHAETLSL